MEKTVKFLMDNFKTIATACVFLMGLYIQHVINTQRIDTLEARCRFLDAKIDNQYQKIDGLKLDKSVFEATIQQFSIMRADIREIRNDLKEVLKSSNKHND